MADYSQGKIYTIRCTINPEYIYVGSTILTLEKRLQYHKSKCKIQKTRKLYKKINEEFSGEWCEWYIELYENYPCNNKEELRLKEGEIIRLIGTLNRVIAGRTHKKYREDNKEEIKNMLKKYREKNIDYFKEYRKKRYENNKEQFKMEQRKQYENNKEIINEKRKQKTICDCGCEIRKDDLKRHQKTQTHINKILDLATTGITLTNINDITT
jgi:hypothetical protein